MSLGSTGSCSQPYRDAMTRSSAASVVVVSSAGNTAGHAVSTPANCPGVIAVGGPAPRRRQGGLLRPRARRSRSARRAATASPPAHASPACYPIMTTSNAGRRRRWPAPPERPTPTASPRLRSAPASRAPLVAGAVGLMLSVKPSLTPAPGACAAAGDGATVPDHRRQRRHAAMRGADRPSTRRVLLHHRLTCGAGMLDVHAALVAARRRCRRGSRSATADADRRPAGRRSASSLGDRRRPERHLSSGRSSRPAPPARRSAAPTTPPP